MNNKIQLLSALVAISAALTCVDCNAQQTRSAQTALPSFNSMQPATGVAAYSSSDVSAVGWSTEIEKATSRVDKSIKVTKEQGGNAARLSGSTKGQTLKPELTKSDYSKGPSQTKKFVALGILLLSTTFLRRRRV